MNRKLAPVLITALLLLVASFAAAGAVAHLLDTNRWRNVYPNYNAIAGLSASDIWAVGNSGVIQHYDGANWSDVASPLDGSTSLNGVAMVNTNEGWAVGGNGTTIHYTGGAWSLVSNPAGSNSLSSVSVAAGNPNDVWAAGFGGIIMHYTGSWSLSFTASNNLYGIFMLDATHGWAVGQGGVAYKYDGSTWTVDNPTAYNFYSVYATAANDVWEAGDNGHIRHYDGSAWSDTVPVDNLIVQNIYMLNAGEGWAVGTHKLLHYTTGNGWVDTFNSNLPFNQMNAVYASASNNAWALGQYSTRLHWTGSWAVDRTSPVAPTSVTLRAVSMDSQNDGWAVGDAGNLVHYTGNEDWVVPPTPTGGPNLFDVDMVGSNKGFSVGADINNNGVLLQYDGSSWNYATIPSALQLDGVSVYITNSLTLGWAVGFNGQILRYDGTTWTNQTSPTSAQLNAVSIITSTEAWAVGSGGVILHYTSGSNSWVSFASPTTQNLNAVRMDSASDGWAVGDNHTILHYNGGSWATVACPNCTGVGNLLGLYIAPDGGDGWATSEAGVMIHFDGTTWSRFSPVPAQSDLYGVSLSLNYDGWAVGDQGTFLHWFGPPLVGTPTPTAPPSATSTNTPLPTGTNTPGPTSTATGTPGPSSTPTNTPTVTNTPGPSNTPTSTETPGGPTDTPTDTATPTLTSTAPPTATPTNTSTPAPTNTPGGPTNTPTKTNTPLPITPTNTGTPLATPTATATDCGIQFADVTPANSIFYPYVHWLACANAISGFPDRLFHPSANATRGQFAKIIVSAYGWPHVTPASGSTFSDVTPSSMWFVYVQTLVSRNVTHGYTGSDCTTHGAVSPCYLPNRNILRSELVRMIVKARNWTIDTSGGPNFSDVPTSYWAYIYIETAYHHGVITGSGTPPAFRPNDNIRRDELCKVVVLGITNPVTGP